MTYSEQFQLDVCAGTYNDPNGAAKDGNNLAVYTRLATAAWEFSASGGIVGAAPNYPVANPFNMSVAILNEWSSVTDGSRASMAGTAMNTLSAKERFKKV